MLKRTLYAVALLTICVFGQSELFVRKAQIKMPAIENAGFGNIVAGVDLDNDGKKEIYAVNNNWDDAGAQLVPRIYKFEFNGTTWDSVWSATLDVPLQNTWPALEVADLDGDGKKEIIWCPVNNTNATNPKPARIVVFEAKGDTSNVMGVPNGSGGYRPNAQWVMDTTALYNLRPFRITLKDFNRDGKPEIVFGDRASSTTGYRFGVIGVSNIPDNGDGSETWTMLASGKTSTLTSGQVYDQAIIDSTIYLIHSTGAVTPVRYANGTYTIGNPQLNVVPGGSWKSASVVDLDNNGTKEIVAAGWSGTTSTKIYLIEKSGDTLKTTEIADFSPLIGPANTTRMYGGAAGDIDADGKLDFVFGTRDAVPNGAIVRLSYKGGPINAATSYATSIIDKEFVGGTAVGRWDVVSIANLDADNQLEVCYTNGYGSSSGPEARTPIVVLKRVALNNIPIAAARIDANNDGKPDRLGETVTVLGVVNGINFTKSSNRWQYSIQDSNSGIVVTKGSITGGGPVYKFGDRLLVRGTLSYFRGTTQMDVADLAADVTLIDTSNVVPATLVSIPEMLVNGEKYESRYIEMQGVAKTASSAAWPAANADANMTIWDGYQTVTLRVDKDTDLDDNAQPTWPVNIKGVATQFTPDTTSATQLQGYQISPSFYSEITQNVAAPPTKYFFLRNPANNAKIIVTDTATSYTANWTKSVDLNNDAIQYQFVLLTTPNQTSTVLTDSFYTFKGSRIVTWLGTRDSLTTRWTVKAKGAEATFVTSVDTFTITFVKRLTKIDDAQAPSEFFVKQNYPNPFNPSTTIKFGLPQAANVDLRIYNVLGQEVAQLVNNQSLSAGVHSYEFDGSKLASGTYIYRLKAGNNVVTKKMNLLK